MSELFEALASSSSARLEEALRQGVAPAPEALVGWEFRGFNVGPVAARLGIQKFIKGFFRGPAGVEGYNIRVRQNGLAGPWQDRPGAERFGFFLVGPVDPSGRDNLYPRATLLDYGASRRNAWWRIERLLRDYLMVPDPAQPEVLLGKAYLAVAGARWPAGFFVLERLRPASPAP